MRSLNPDLLTRLMALQQYKIKHAYVKAGVITSRLRIGRPGKTNSKEQNFISADEQTPTKLRQLPRDPIADEQTPISERRWTLRRWLPEPLQVRLRDLYAQPGALSSGSCGH
jgi:hypothetical protein